MNRLSIFLRLTLFFLINPHRFIFVIADLSLLTFEYLLALAEWLADRADALRDALAEWKDKTPLFGKRIADSLIAEYRNELQAKRIEASKKAAEAIMPKKDDRINQ